MAKFRKSIQVGVPASKAWQVIGDLTFMGGLAGATEVKMDGMKRICTFPNGAIQHEEITNYSPGERSYNYAIEGSPLPVKNNRGGFAVQPVGSECKVIWEAEFDPLDPSQQVQISQMWEGAMTQVLESLKQQIEGKK